MYTHIYIRIYVFIVTVLGRTDKVIKRDEVDPFSGSIRVSKRFRDGVRLITLSTLVSRPLSFDLGVSFGPRFQRLNSIVG